EPVRLRLGLARLGRAEAGGRAEREPGHAALERKDSLARRRRLGARLLPEVPESASRVPERVVEHGQLGEGGGTLRGGQSLTVEGLAARAETEPPGSGGPPRHGGGMTLPNVITLIRVAMVPVVMALILADFEDHERWAAVAYIAAAATDSLDGYL